MMKLFKKVCRKVAMCGTTKKEKKNRTRDILNLVKQCFTAQRDDDEDSDDEYQPSVQVHEDQRVIQQPSTRQHLPIFNTVRLPQIPIVTLSSMRIDVLANNNITPESKQIEDVGDDLTGIPVCVADCPTVTIEKNMVESNDVVGDITGIPVNIIDCPTVTIEKNIVESKQIKDVVGDLTGIPFFVIDRPIVTIKQNMVAEQINVDNYSLVPSCQFINHIPPTIPQVNVKEFDILRALFEIDSNKVSDRQVVGFQPKATDFHIDRLPKITAPKDVVDDLTGIPVSMIDCPIDTIEKNMMESKEMKDVLTKATDFHVDRLPKPTRPNQAKEVTNSGSTQVAIYRPKINSIQEDVAPSAETDCPIPIEEVISEPTPVNFPTTVDEFLPYVMDVSLETCNPMSETYNAIRRCAEKGHLSYDREYAIIGSLDGSKVATDFIPHALAEDHPFSIAANLMCNAGFKVMIGRWNLVSQPTAILIEVHSAFHILDHCKGLLQSDGGLNIQDGDFLANYSLVFGFLVGHFITMVGDIAERQAEAASVNKDPVVVHFHEWSSATGLLFLKQGNISSATTFYTSHQLPIDNFIQTAAFDINWINHRTAIEDLGQLSATLYVPNMPEDEEDLHQLYFKAYDEESRMKRTWHFDVTYNVNEVIGKKILTHAASAKALNYEGRHVIVIPNEAQWRLMLDLVDHKSIKGPIGLAIQGMKLRGYKTVVGHLKIPSRPLVILFETGSAKEELVTKLKHEMRNYSVSPESLADFCTLEKVFDYLVTAFFSIFNHESDRVDNIPGEAYPKVIRQYYIRDESC